MKLSERILKGADMYPEAEHVRGTWIHFRPDGIEGIGACAIGFALLSTGISPAEIRDKLMNTYPTEQTDFLNSVLPTKLKPIVMTCPACTSGYIYPTWDLSSVDTFRNFVIHLNDSHELDLEEITKILDGFGY